MKLNQNLVLFVILIYPLLLGLPFIQNDIGLALNVYYFTIPCFFLFGILLCVRNKVRLARVEFSGLLLLLLLIVQCMLFFNKLTFPIVFFSSVAVSIITFYNLSGALSGRMVYLIVIAYFASSLIAFLNPSNFALFGRFSGFTISASTFSSFITGVFIVFYFTSKVSRRTKVIVYIGFLLLITLSETRLNLLLYLLLPFVFWVYEKGRLRFLTLFGFVVALNLVYPTYSMVVAKSNTIAKLRYEDGRDASFQLRYALFKDVWNEYSAQPFLAKIFGAGPEAARALIKKAYGDDHMPHQDFVRLLYDFGIFGFVIFLVFIFQQALTNRISYALSFLFFLSFFHNMIFNLFIVLLIVFFSTKSLRDKTATAQRQAMIGSDSEM